MSIEMDEEIKRWTARRESALVLDIIQARERHRKRLVPTVPPSGLLNRILY